MVSEDSDQVVSGLFSIHRLSDSGDVRKARMGPMDSGINRLSTARELFEIALLCRTQLVRREERTIVSINSLRRRTTNRFRFSRWLSWRRLAITLPTPKKLMSSYKHETLFALCVTANSWAT